MQHIVFVSSFFSSSTRRVIVLLGRHTSEWDAQSSTRPLDGAYALRKPDITCYFQALEGVRKWSWEQVVTFCEVKNRADSKRDKESFIELAGKVSCLLGVQDGRHFVLSIRILGSLIYLTTFHRSGSITTCPFNINSSPLQFLQIIISVSFSDYATIGFDMSIKWDMENHTSKPPGYR